MADSKHQGSGTGPATAVSISPPFPAPSHFQHDGFRLAYYAAGPADGPPVYLLHGWPELAYSWAHQMPALAGAGYRVIAPELRGFGASDAPHGKEHYAIAQLVSDLEALMDHLGHRTITLVGHDWGGIILWQAARMLGDPAVVEWGRIDRVASICTPMVRQAPVDPLKIFRKRFGDDHYFLVFTEEPDETAALFARDPDAFFRMVMRGIPEGYAMESRFTHIPKQFREFLDRGAPEVKGGVLTPDQRRVYVDAYTRSGFHGGIALYRNTTENWELTQGLSERLTQPALMISPELDMTLPPSSTDHMPALIDDLERVILPDCSHWAMWEKPEEVNALLLGWLGKPSRT